VNDRLTVRGAREHNLRSVDVDLPRNALTVFTGLSGSGKSSLAFDTIFAEGQRRYVESLSAYARQFLGQLRQPDVDAIEGLSPALAINQKSVSANPRSTVGTVTEIYDHLRLLWARTGLPHCPACGELVARHTPQQIVARTLELPEGTRFHVLAPVAPGEAGGYRQLFSGLQAQGFARVRVDGTVYPLTGPPELRPRDEHAIELVVDRLTARPSARQRLTDSVETALRLGAGRVLLELVDRAGDDPARISRYSETLSCPSEHPLAVAEIEPGSFSFNSPSGACPVCTGLGVRREPDLTLIVPDTTRSLAQGAIAPWAGWQERDYFQRLLRGLADARGLDLDAPWDELPEAARAAVLHGTGDADRRPEGGTGGSGGSPPRADTVHISYRTRGGRDRSYDVTYPGVLPWLQRQLAAAESDAAREQLAGFLCAVPCPACAGARLRPEILAVTVGGRSIAEVTAMPAGEAARWLRGLELTGTEQLIAGQVLREIQARLGFLADVGLGYLSLDRAARTLAAGEAQRIRLATQLGSGLAGVLYVLDEPSAGLHPQDNRALLQTLTRLRDLGNTLIVVEHDQDTIRAADWVVDVGPRAGQQGGQIVVSGTVADLEASAESLTGAYLSGRRRIAVPARRRARRPGADLVVEGAREHNLRDIDVAIPLGQLVVVTGVSGSGKSSLVSDILYPVLASRLAGAKVPAGRHRRVTGTEQLDQVIGVDQSPIGRTPRSNPATYTGVFDHIRRLFAQTAEARLRGYQPGRFSFNVRGGRCEHCQGEGTIRIEMSFLPDVYVPCEVCRGARYNPATLEVRYKGKTISEVLDMPVDEAAEFFAPVERIARRLRALAAVGLGYLRLGQPATTLSGGEAQRVKLAAELQRRSTGRTVYVLDEPTTGLHPEDVRQLLEVLQSLVDRGNTVLMVEHNLDVIKTADWVIDLGPGGGPDGGLVVAAGTPEDVSQVAGSATGQFLRPLLATGGWRQAA
jgi:excinuclease ABC subunit A